MAKKLSPTQIIKTLEEAINFAETIGREEWEQDEETVANYAADVGMALRGVVRELKNNNPLVAAAKEAKKLQEPV